MESWAWGAVGAAALVERGRHGHVVCPGREAAPVAGVREGLLRLPLLLATLGAAELDGAHFAVEGAEPAGEPRTAQSLAHGWRMGILDPPPQRTGGCGGPRPRCSAASPPQRRPKPQPCLSKECGSSRSAAEAVPASVTEPETAPDGRRIEPNHGRNRPLTPTYGRAALKCSAAPAAEQDRRSTFGRRAASKFF